MNLSFDEYRVLMFKAVERLLNEHCGNGGCADENSTDKTKYNKEEYYHYPIIISQDEILNAYLRKCNDVCTAEGSNVYPLMQEAEKEAFDSKFFGFVSYFARKWDIVCENGKFNDDSMLDADRPSLLVRFYPKGKYLA